jgi:hypothetical protein
MLAGASEKAISRYASAVALARFYEPGEREPR